MLLPSGVIILCVVSDTFNHLPVIYIFQNIGISFIVVVCGGGILYKVRKVSLECDIFLVKTPVCVVQREKKNRDSRGYFSCLSRDSNV